MKEDYGISIECLNKILDEFDYENYLFSKPTTKFRYYLRKFFKKICELINFLIKFIIYYIFVYVMYKICGPNTNWNIMLLTLILVGNEKK